VPLVLAIYDYWHKQPRRSSVDDHPESNGDAVDSRSTFGGRGSYLVSALCLSFANALQPSALAAPRSTYICPLSSLTRANTLLIQSLAILLDCHILSSSHTIFHARGLAGALEDGIALAALGHIFLVSPIAIFESRDTRH